MSDNVYTRDPLNEGERAPGTMGLAAMWTGIASLACVALMFCTCYASLFAAFPLGIVSMFAGFQAINDPETPALAKQMAIGGIVSAVISVLISGAFGAFIVLYVGFIMFIGVVGNL